MKHQCECQGCLYINKQLLVNLIEDFLFYFRLIDTNPYIYEINSLNLKKDKYVQIKNPGSS